jgi:Cu(I)/Ag(I) efflux system membrane fusion protein
MTTAAGSMQNSSTTTSSLTLKEGDYIKKEVVFVSEYIKYGVFDARAEHFDKDEPTIWFSSEFDQNDFINAKVDFIETQLSETDKTNRIRVYLNNSNLKFRLD